MYAWFQKTGVTLEKEVESKTAILQVKNLTFSKFCIYVLIISTILPWTVCTLLVVFTCNILAQTEFASVYHHNDDNLWCHQSM